MPCGMLMFIRFTPLLYVLDNVSCKLLDRLYRYIQDLFEIVYNIRDSKFFICFGHNNSLSQNDLYYLYLRLYKPN